MRTKMKLSSLFTEFTNPDSNFLLKMTFGTNVLGVVASWLANNWYVLGGFVIASVVPMYMSWQKHREELRHARKMNEIEERKAENEVTQIFTTGNHFTKKPIEEDEPEEEFEKSKPKQ